MNSCFGSSKRTGALQEFAGRLAVMFSAKNGRSWTRSNSAKFFINAMKDALTVRFRVCSKESVG